MTSYEDFKSHLQEQSEAPHKGDWKQIIEKSKFLRRQLLGTQVILGITISVLIYFFFYISAHRVAVVAVALLTMIGILLLRVVFEFISVVWLRKLDFKSKIETFGKQANKYVGFRKVVQFIVTPVCFFIYLMGFIVLLPYFKEELSQGFYSYILISGVITFVILGLLIGYGVRKEHKVLRMFR